MGQETGPHQPPYPLHPAVLPRLAADYAAFYNEHLVDQQQVHLRPVEASRQSGVLIPGAGPLYPVARTEDFSIPRAASTGPDLKIRCFTPHGKKPAKGWPCLLYYHGGGWVLGNIDTENVIATNLCGRASCVVVSVDYRSAFPDSSSEPPLFRKEYSILTLTPQTRARGSISRCSRRRLGRLAMGSSRIRQRNALY